MQVALGLLLQRGARLGEHVSLDGLQRGPGERCDVVLAVGGVSAAGHTVGRLWNGGEAGHGHLGLRGVSIVQN